MSTVDRFPKIKTVVHSQEMCDAETAGTNSVYQQVRLY